MGKGNKSELFCILPRQIRKSDIAKKKITFLILDKFTQLLFLSINLLPLIPQLYDVFEEISAEFWMCICFLIGCLWYVIMPLMPFYL